MYRRSCRGHAPEDVAAWNMIVSRHPEPEGRYHGIDRQALRAFAPCVIFLGQLTSRKYQGTFQENAFPGVEGSTG